MSQTQRCRVVRGFRHNATIQGPGTVLDLEKNVASELRMANKLEFVAANTELCHTTELPDPNRRLADRQARRDAALANFATAARATVGSSRRTQP